MSNGELELDSARNWLVLSSTKDLVRSSAPEVMGAFVRMVCKRTLRSGLCVLQVECVQHGLRTIAFCKTRKLCELVITYTREMLRQSAPHLSHAISVYRAGYNPTVSSFCRYLCPVHFCNVTHDMWHSPIAKGTLCHPGRLASFPFESLLWNRELKFMRSLSCFLFISWDDALVRYQSSLAS